MDKIEIRKSQYYLFFEICITVKGADRMHQRAWAHSNFEPNSIVFKKINVKICWIAHFTEIHQQLTVNTELTSVDYQNPDWSDFDGLNIDGQQF